MRVCDVVTINAPLHPETEHMFNDALIGKMKRGAYLVNTARGKICDRDAIVRALESGQLAGYAGDVWFPQPPPRTTLAHHAAPRHDAPRLGHVAVGAGSLRGGHPRDPGVLVRGRPIREEYLIVDGGKLAGAGAHSYSAGNTTAGSEEAERFKRR